MHVGPDELGALSRTRFYQAVMWVDHHQTTAAQAAAQSPYPGGE